MTLGYDAARPAEGKIRLAILRLADEFAFHASMLERFRVVSRPDVGTMAVSVAGDDVMLLHNPTFVLAISTDELGGVLLHEIHHVLLGHVVSNPVEFPDEWARTVAEEVTVNEFVKLPLPGTPITLDSVPGLPPMESTRERYDRLKRRRVRQRVDPPKAPTGVGEKSDRVGAAARTTQGPRHSSAKLGRTVDDHRVWAEALQDAARSRQAIRELVRQAVLEIGGDRIPDHLKSAINDIGIGLGQGSESLQTYEDLHGTDRGRLDWRRLLRRYIGKKIESRPLLNLPPRRFPELVGIIPGRRRQVARPRIMGIIDTSGSITAKLLEQIDAELSNMARRFSVLVVECDAAVQRVYPYRRIEFVSGRGGTDFQPPLTASFLKRHRPDLIVYFTDGFGPAPNDAPRIPLIWVLAPGGIVPAPWGRTIRMDDSPGRGAPTRH